MMVEILRNRAGKLPLIIVIVLGVVLLAGIGTMVFVKSGKKKDGKAAEKHVQLVHWEMDEFIVNLADREPRYLKIAIVLEVEAGDKKAGGHGEGGGKAAPAEDAKARDAVITVLTSKRFVDLISDDGKVNLKKELKSALNKVLGENKVANIYFTSFAVQ